MQPHSLTWELSNDFHIMLRIRELRRLFRARCRDSVGEWHEAWACSLLADSAVDIGLGSCCPVSRSLHSSLELTSKNFLGDRLMVEEETLFVCLQSSSGVANRCLP